MAKLKLHLDADTSKKALHKALIDKGHDVTRTPNSWMPLDASDEVQLSQATAQGRAIFTFNVKDFIALDKKQPQHGGIILAAQNSWMLSELIAALDALLSDEESENLIGQVRWLNQWRV
jgi:hypothetical protein